MVKAQGHQFTAIVANLDAQDHQQTGAELDREGDALRDRLANVLTVATALAKRARQYEVHSRLVEAMSIVRRIAELDDAEDYHLIAEASAGVERALGSMRSSVEILESLVAIGKEDMP